MAPLNLNVGSLQPKASNSVWGMRGEERESNVPGLAGIQPQQGVKRQNAKRVVITVRAFLASLTSSDYKLSSQTIQGHYSPH